MHEITEKTLLQDSLKELEFYRVLQHIARHCISEPGKEIILETEPSEDIQWLRTEHSLVEELRLVAIRNEHLPIEGLYDMRPMLQKSLIQGAFLTPTELLAVHDTIRASRLLRLYFRDKEELYPAIRAFVEQLHENRFFEKHITDAIDETGTVKDNASRELATIRKDIQETTAKLRSKIQKILRQVVEEDRAMEEFITQREGRFVLPIKAEAKRQIPGIIHGVSQTGSTVFLEPAEIFDWNNQLSLLLHQEQREIVRILTTLTGELGGEAVLFMGTADILAHFDALAAKGIYAVEKGGIMPEIVDFHHVELQNVYHPLLSVGSGKKPIPLSAEFDEHGRGYLISGPNAGGKTVALKNIGLNIAMALSGIFPLGNCRTNPRLIFTAVGDHQSIEQNLSTFSSQIVRLRDILSFCSHSALVLIDEICSGTDPQEGGALAAGILDSLIERHAFFVVTTHQSSLKTYALNREEIKNASMEFDENKLAPTYKFLSGIPGNSYAFVLAQSVGIPPHILENARNYLGDRQSEIEKSIAALQRYKSEAEQHTLKVAEERLKAENARKEYEKKFEEFKVKYKQLVGLAREEAQDIVQKANALVENTIREIREQQKPVSEIRKNFEKEKQEITKKATELKKQDDISKPSGFIVGDAVTMGDAQDIGVIIDIDEQSKAAQVEFNGVKFKLPLVQLRRASKSKIKQTAQSKHVAGYVKLDARASTDVRGFRADEACKEVERLVSDAVLANLPSVTIIHGKGTGALRQAIHDQLSRHGSVSSFRNGAITEGNDGVTIVEIK
ncbi:MAG: Smr/MutS family protein [Ignavibacteria bacterium]|nr:Smr/MutS family protein [Ignavibacteria bacterium]